MLQRLTVRNLALIKHIEIEFSPELNVFSGETGAGKSIIVDSLMLLLGARYDKSLLKFGADSGYVEGVFQTDSPAPLEDAGIECDDGVFIVSRKFYRDGRNDIRVNGKSVTAAMLRELMQYYADIYGQNEYQSLLKLGEQRKMLDCFVFGRDQAPLAEQKELFDSYKSIKKEMASLGDGAERARRIDVLNYQIDEIESAKVKPNEEQTLIDRRHLLMASERIKSALGECADAIDGDDGAGSMTSAAMHALSSVSSFGENFSALYDRLRSVSIELDDISECVKSELDGMDGGERELDETVARLDKLRALKAKYGNYDAMRKFLSDAKAERERLENGEALYNELCAREKEAENALYDSCVRLSNARKAGAKELQNKVLAELNDLGMANSAFEVKFGDAPSRETFLSCASAVGFDAPEFYLSPNIGQPLLPLAKIISGGEMSRFMLAVKLITGGLSDIGTMIFDEIDTGISGAVGLCVAKKLAELSRGRQVLCVTHLPQIAAMADGHFFIEKTEKNGDTSTRVTVLDHDGMIGEISRLSGTKGVSSSSDKNAAELKAFGDKFKAERK